MTDFVFLVFIALELYDTANDSSDDSTDESASNNKLHEHFHLGFVLLRGYYFYNTMLGDFSCLCPV